MLQITNNIHEKEMTEREIIKKQKAAFKCEVSDLSLGFRKSGE